MLGALSPLLTLVGCTDLTTPIDDETTTEATEPVTGSTTETTEPSTTPEPPPPPPPPAVLSAPAIVYGVANWDNGFDWLYGPDPDDGDLSVFEVTPSETPADTITFSIDSTDLVRVYIDGLVIFDADRTSLTIPWNAAPLEVIVEFGHHDIERTMTIEETSQDEVVQRVDVQLRSAPLLVNHHLQETEAVVAVQVQSSPFFDNAALVQGYIDALGPLFTAIPGTSYNNDVWVQDEIQFATATTPDSARMDVVIDSIRDRGLDPYPEDAWLGDDFGVVTWGTGFPNSLDSFGNFEVAPPVAGYPLGRIYYGGSPDYSPNDQALFDFLTDQGEQAPFMVDSTWLCVGHVDEFMTFVPDASAPRGFRFVMTSTDDAWAVLDAMDRDMELPRYAGSRNHGYDTVAELVDDNGLRMQNRDLQTDWLDPIEAQMKAELGLMDEEIIYMPGLFETVPFCGGTVAALIPGMVNLVVVNEPGANPKLFLPDPFLRSDLSDQSTDPMIAAVRAAMPSGSDLFFLDDWEVYHLGLGEVHCGTNSVRTPDQDWWTNDMGGK